MKFIQATYEVLKDKATDTTYLYDWQKKVLVNFYEKFESMLEEELSTSVTVRCSDWGGGVKSTKITVLQEFACMDDYLYYRYVLKGDIKSLLS